MCNILYKPKHLSSDSRLDLDPPFYTKSSAFKVIEWINYGAEALTVSCSWFSLSMKFQISTNMSFIEVLKTQTS